MWVQEDQSPRPSSFGQVTTDAGGSSHRGPAMQGEKKLLCCGCRRPAYFCLLKKNTASLRTGDTHQISTNKNPHLAGILSGGRSVVRHGRTGAFARVKTRPRCGGLIGNNPGYLQLISSLARGPPFFFPGSSPATIGTSQTSTGVANHGRHSSASAPRTGVATTQELRSDSAGAASAAQQHPRSSKAASRAPQDRRCTERV